MSETSSDDQKRTFLRGVWNQNKEALSLYALFLGIGIIGLIYLYKGDAVLIVQHYHNRILDHIMIFITDLGDGLPYVVCAILAAIFFSFRHTIIIGLTGCVVSVVVSGLKWLFGYPRPVVFFDWLGNDEFRELAMMPLGHSFNSFPSGHTTAAFALYFLILFMSQRLGVKYFAVVLALLVGISRMYLGKHFLEDVVFGSLLGITIAYFAYSLYSEGPKLGEWSNKNLQMLVK